jgi:hypothetical protein
MRWRWRGGAGRMQGAGSGGGQAGWGGAHRAWLLRELLGWSWPGRLAPRWPELNRPACCSRNITRQGGGGGAAALGGAGGGQARRGARRAGAAQGRPRGAAGGAHAAQEAGARRRRQAGLGVLQPGARVLWAGAAGWGSGLGASALRGQLVGGALLGWGWGWGWAGGCRDQGAGGAALHRLLLRCWGCCSQGTAHLPGAAAGPVGACSAAPSPGAHPRPPAALPAGRRGSRERGGGGRGAAGVRDARRV